MTLSRITWFRSHYQCQCHAWLRQQSGNVAFAVILILIHDILFVDVRVRISFKHITGIFLGRAIATWPPTNMTKRVSWRHTS